MAPMWLHDAAIIAVSRRFRRYAQAHVARIASQTPAARISTRATGRCNNCGKFRSDELKEALRG